MALTLNGNPGNITTPLTATITAFANNGAGLIRVTTAAPHLFGPNDSVTITTGLITGTYAITVISATQFDLIGSTYISTSTGTASDTSLTPQVLVPTDGDQFSQQLSGALSSIQALLDRDQYINQQILGVAALIPTLRAFQFRTSLGTSTAVSASAKGNNPTEIYTGTAHNLQTGMWVNIAGGSGDTTINGNFPVTVVDADNISIPVQSNGTYASNTATITPIVPPGVTAMILDGWGGGGGGEQGGGYSVLEDNSSVAKGPYVAGGAGAGARRTVVSVSVTPLQSIAITQGAGGAGGSGAVAYPAAAGADGGQTVVSFAGSHQITFDGGKGAGAGQPTYPGPVGYSSFTEDAIFAPGGAGGNAPASYNRPWAQACGIPSALQGYLSTSSVSNIGDYIDQGEGAGGAAVIVYVSGAGVHYPTKPSTPGMSQSAGLFTNLGGAAGARGADSGSGPAYLGGPGGGGGGAGPGGSGGNGGAGTNGNGSGNSSTGGAGVTGGGAAGWTGAGGGGGGSAGAASGTTAAGGAGGAGDGGAVTLLWVSP